MRRSLFVTNEGCGTVIYPEKLPLLLEKGYISRYSIKPTLQYSVEEIYTCLDYYFRELLKIYNEDQIILVEVRSCLYTSSDATKRLGIFNETETINEDNAAYDMAYQYARSKLPKAHVIPFPAHMMCDFFHRWGNYKLHYIEEYYKYALRAVDTITCGRYDKDTENLIISSLCEDTNRFCMRRKEEFTYFTTKYKMELDGLCGRLKKYEYYFKTVAMRNRMETIRDFFQCRLAKTIVFFGLNEISKFFIDMLQEMEAFDKRKVLIAENGYTEYQGMIVCPRKVEKFLEMEYIIVCDVMNIQRIKDRLKQLDYAGSVKDLYEIANIEKT